MAGVEREQRVEEFSVAARRDARLQASRRLDWRFLLPDPDLDRVLYVGPSRGSLSSALASFTLSMTNADEADPIEKGAFSLVVACNPTIAALRRAVDGLGPDGVLYLELERRFGRSRGAARPGARALRAEIKRLGFTKVSLAWHWPDFDACTRIVPLGPRDALVAAMQAGVHSAAARILVRALVRPRLVERLAPSLSIVARR